MRVLALFLGLLPLLQGQQATPPPFVDPDYLGRTTPRGTLLGFLGAIHRTDYRQASAYLNTPLTGDAAEELAHQFGDLLDARLPANVDGVSNASGGNLTDNLPPSRDLAGTLPSTIGPIPVYLDRINKGRQTVWLFSSETLERTQKLAEDTHEFGFEPYLPSPILRRGWLAIPIWKWLALLISLILGWVLSGALHWLAARSLLLLLKGAGSTEESPFARLSAPLRLILVFFFVQFTTALLTLPLVSRWALGKVFAPLNILLLAWAFVRVCRVGGQVFRQRLERIGRADTKAVVLLGQRTLIGLTVFTAVVGLMQIAGYNATALLASLGVGGIAVALAAQKTIENLFGGVALILDKSVRVGDFCKIGDRTGTVEEIGLRSTRIRTLDRSLLIVPNGQLSIMNLENFGMRDRILFRHNLAIQGETQAGQVVYLLTELRQLLYGHPMIDSSNCRARLMELGVNSLNIQVFAYIKTTDWPLFLEAQEALLLQILGIVEAAGTSMAFPTQVLYLGKDAKLERAQAQIAVATTEGQRNAGPLPRQGSPELTPEGPSPVASIKNNKK